MSHEHLCKSCVYTVPPKVGEECGNGYLYLEPKVACAGHEVNLAEPRFDGEAKYDSNTADSGDYDSIYDSSDASSDNIHLDIGDSSSTLYVEPRICNKCGEEIDYGWGFHLTPPDEDKFHLHSKCLKALLKHLIKLEKSGE